MLSSDELLILTASLAATPLPSAYDSYRQEDVSTHEYFLMASSSQHEDRTSEKSYEISYQRNSSTELVHLVLLGRDRAGDGGREGKCLEEVEFHGESIE